VAAAAPQRLRPVAAPATAPQRLRPVAAPTCLRSAGARPLMRPVACAQPRAGSHALGCAYSACLRSAASGGQS